MVAVLVTPTGGLAELGSGTTSITIPVMGEKPSKPVIQERETSLSSTEVTIRSVTGAGGTVCVCVCAHVCA